jgi:hypothetical protein
MNSRDSSSREGTMPKMENYKSKESYRKANAYRHIHGIKSQAHDVKIAGRKHKVKHGTKRAGKK